MYNPAWRFPWKKTTEALPHWALGRRGIQAQIVLSLESLIGVTVAFLMETSRDSCVLPMGIEVAAADGGQRVYLEDNVPPQRLTCRRAFEVRDLRCVVAGNGMGCRCAWWWGLILPILVLDCDQATAASQQY
jgi:hypothetical protein